MSDGGNFGNLSDNEVSPILITRYANRAVTLISSIEKILYFLIVSMLTFAIIVFFDITAIKGFIPIFSDDTIDLILFSIAIIMIGVLMFIIKMVLNTRKKLDKWATMFERNSLRTAISIGMTNMDKNALLHSIIENLTDIGESIDNYVKYDTRNKDLFFNQTINEKISFDILIDVSKVSKNSKEATDLNSKLVAYGSIIANISTNSEVLDTQDVKLFVDNVLDYVKVTGNNVGLAILVAPDFTNEAFSFVSYFSNKSIGYLILIEKPLPVVSLN